MREAVSVVAVVAVVVRRAKAIFLTAWRPAVSGGKNSIATIEASLPLSVSILWLKVAVSAATTVASSVDVRSTALWLRHPARLNSAAAATAIAAFIVDYF